MPGPQGPQGVQGPTGATGTVPQNFYEVFVQAGAVGGTGTQAAPFATIAEGFSAVLPGGTLHILGGTYPVSTQLNINKAGVTLQGSPDTVVILEAAVVPLLITAGGVTIRGLTITSSLPFAVEFIQVGAANALIENNTIYGPEQAGPSDQWVVNRGFVPQPAVSNLIVRGNILHSLRQPAYLNPGSTGFILNNVVYNTRGFVVDSAIFLISNNAWGSPVNASDISLFAGTPAGPPYDPLTELAASNSDASISDQR